MTHDTHPEPDPRCDRVRIGIVSISDRASTGVYEDKGLPPCVTGSVRRC